MLGIKLVTISHEILVAAYRLRTLESKQDEQNKFDKLCFHILKNIF